MSGRILVRIYLCTNNEDFEDLESVSHSDQISCINRPVEINKEGKYFTLLDAVKSILLELFYPTVEAEGLLLRCTALGRPPVFYFITSAGKSAVLNSLIRHPALVHFDTRYKIGLVKFQVIAGMKYF
ncbi:hypothetical protein L1887_13916 [Cichorium endivia]|nr:hypothetical protein L1887_13916 [Cichorium endivia]